MKRHNEGLIIIIVLLSMLTFELFYFSLEPSITGYQLQSGDDSVVTRTLGSASPNQELTVQLDVNIDSAFDHYVYAIEEHVPNNWQIQSATGGQIDGQTIKYSFIEEYLGQPVKATSKTFSYTIIAPASGTYTFSGSYVIDGMDNLGTIQGDAQVSIQECTGSQTRGCTAANGCSGIETCSGGTYGLCIATQQLCDINCDGNEVCTSNTCQECECTGAASKSCTTINGCIGSQNCISGSFGECVRTYNYCDANCDGVDECTQSACPNCQCTEDKICLTANGCAGTQACTNGILGECQTTQYYCDSDCDGDQECVDSDCAACPCTGDETQSCTTADGCQGTKTCNSGNFGPCVSTQIFCDSNCDGTPECNDQQCDACDCVEDWVCSGFGDCSDGTQTQTCTDSNSCGTTTHKPEETKTCTTSSNRHSGGGGGGGPSSSTHTSTTSNLGSCNPTWLCKKWSACSIDGIMTRTCSDVNNCKTTTSKPKELDTCIYEPTCTDNIMNGNEEGIDCGGDCPFICKVEKKKELKLQIDSEDILGEILDDHIVKATITNIGEIEGENIKIMLDKWSKDAVMIDNLVPGDTREITYNVKLPESASETALDINALKDDINIASKTIKVTLSVPKAKVKFIDKDDLKYPVIILDNRGQEKKTVTAEYQVTKGKETYAMDIIKFETGQDEIYTNVLNDALRSLPDGKYDVKTVFKTGNKVISESKSTFDVTNNKKGINMRVFWYIILIIISVSFIYMIFKR